MSPLTDVVVRNQTPISMAVMLIGFVALGWGAHLLVLGPAGPQPRHVKRDLTALVVGLVLTFGGGQVLVNSPVFGKWESGWNARTKEVPWAVAERSPSPRQDEATASGKRELRDTIFAMLALALLIDMSFGLAAREGGPKSTRRTVRCQQ